MGAAWAPHRSPLLRSPATSSCLAWEMELQSPRWRARSLGCSDARLAIPRAHDAGSVRSKDVLGGTTHLQPLHRLNPARVAWVGRCAETVPGRSSKTSKWQESTEMEAHGLWFGGLRWAP